VKRRLLLDTQAFVLAAEGEKVLSPKARTALLHQETDIYLSLVSLWEMQIKLGLGKLKLPVSLPMAVQKAVTGVGLEILPLQAEHIYKLSDLPFHHRDPFDRLLIAQALHEQMVVIGNDSAFDAYGIERIW
jgi:PIN domain nuclease of toxin-antitoxin system